MPLVVHYQNGVEVRDERVVFGEREGVGEVSQALSGGYRECGYVGRVARVAKERHAPEMVAVAVPVGEGERVRVLRARYLLGVDVQVVGDVVAEENHVVGAVGILLPERVEVHLVLLDVLPLHVYYLAVGERPRGVVLVHIRRNRADYVFARIVPVQNRHVHAPARHHSPAAA